MEMTSELSPNHYEKNNEKVQANGGWITKEFLRDLISENENDKDIEVVGSKVCAAVGVGDNYLSIIYQMDAEMIRGKNGKKESRRFLIKGHPSAKILRDMIEEYGMFRKEMYMYNVCLPAMRKLAREHIPEDEDFIAAYTYKCNLPDTIVMEDLKLSGYKMAHRRQQLDFDHAATTLKSLARFHAVSLRLIKDQPEVIKEISKDEFFSAKSGMQNDLLEKAGDSWLKVMRGSDVVRDVVPLVEKAIERSMDKMIRVVKPVPGTLSTINHGDSWTNNFMFKYDENGKVIHTKLVDFQLSRYSSPVLDILYFFFSSPQPDVLSDNFDELVRIYHEALISDMEKVQLDPEEYPTMEEILSEMKKRSIFGLNSMITVTPIVVAKPDDMADLENVDIEELKKNDDYMLEKNFRDPYYQELVVKYLKLMDKLGYLKSAEDMVLDEV